MFSPFSESASDYLNYSAPLYCKQPYSLQIIQLVECTAPPPRHISAIDSCSSYVYSSDCSSQDDDEEVCSSYCSSDLPPEELDSDESGSLKPDVPVPSPETYDLRMKRVLAWREDFSTAMTAALSDSTLSNSLKRKFHSDQDEDDVDDNMSHSSKRSRTSDDSTSTCSLGSHSCPACDATFSSQQSLRQHGMDAAKENEACSIAVEYAFE